MPQLPEDIIDRLTQMERRIQQLSTAVNTRPALNTVSDGALSVGRAGDSPVFRVGKWSGAEYGMAVRRQTGELAMSLYNGDGTDTSLQPVRFYDVHGHEILSDDIAAGGIARPWLNMLPPQDTAVARWPQTTATGSFTTIAMSYNVVWQPNMRLLINTRASSGATGQVQVLVNGAQWGGVATTPADFDSSGPISSDFSSVYNTLLKVEIQAVVTSASGTVYANPVLMYGRQT
ncbi:hypothetical protein ACIRBZ_21400 [Streptomyces sp. NPDC094038]|uniref:hypothetical protein n=1 Tax=Streptomyces sp. NPDC094038 TaxID=3366055 RepID=UPI003814912D